MKRLISLISTEGKAPDLVAQEVLQNLERYEQAKRKDKPAPPKR